MVSQVGVGVFMYRQAGKTCGAIKEASKSSKANDERVIINFARKLPQLCVFATHMIFFYFYDKMSCYVMTCHDMYGKK